MQFTLFGKRVLVTGGASGIGFSIASLFQATDGEVVIFDDDDRMFPTLRDIGITPYKVDISSQTEVDRVFAENNLEPFDVLINNAGTDQGFDIRNPDMGRWRQVWDTNVNGPVYLTHKVVQGMLAIGIHGVVIFITSVMAERAYKNRSAYVGSKAALVQITKELAFDLGPHGIRVNSVAPGLIYPTGITGSLNDEQLEDRIQKTPLRRVGRPDDIANACGFLASDSGSFITGQNLVVDGGFLLPGPWTGD